jgi:hypothetical protein
MELLVKMKLGPTAAYGRLHQPSEDDLNISAFRELHFIANSEVAEAYDWTDLPTACGFGIDHLDLDDDVTLPEELQERIDSGDLFFWQADEACAFQGLIQAITGSHRKLPWRYRWPGAVRDEVLARLLALNAERYEEEVNLGLHSKGAKQAAKASRAAGASGAAATGKRRGRPPKSSQPGETEPTQTEQMGLGL